MNETTGTSSDDRTFADVQPRMQAWLEHNPILPDSGEFHTELLIYGAALASGKISQAYYFQLTRDMLTAFAQEMFTAGQRQAA